MASIHQLLQPLEISEECNIPGVKQKLPYGLCNENLADKLPYNKNNFEKYASEIVEKLNLPHATGKATLDKKIANTIVLLNTGHVQSSIETLTKLIKDHSSLPMLYYARSVAYLRKQEENNNQKALEDIEKAMKMETTESEPYERKAAVFAMMGNYAEAIPIATRAVELRPSWRNLYQRGMLYFLLEMWSKSESDLRRVLELKENDVNVMHHLGLTLFHRGKLRKAMHIFNDILELDPSILETILILAETLKRIGDYNNALTVYKRAIFRKPSKEILVEIYQSRAGLYYSAGQIESALKDTQDCLQLDSENPTCLYLRSLCFSSVGQFYDGIKMTTKLMVLEGNQRVRMSPEFIKAHYLREWARYIHARLELDLMDYNVSKELPGDFRDKWMKNFPMEFVVDYHEQVGLQPHISDVSLPNFANIPSRSQDILCAAQSTSRLFSMTTDGHIDNERVMFAMALASIHTAQIIESHWNRLLSPSQSSTSSSSSSKNSGGSTSSSPTVSWRSLVDQTARYLSLAQPENPALWLSDMPVHLLEEGYASERIILRGEEESHLLMPYFDLVFHLLKTMVAYMSGREGSSGEVTLTGTPDTASPMGSVTGDESPLEREINEASTCYDLLKIAKKNGAVSQSGGIIVSTQVPSVKYREAFQHDGDTIVLTEDSQKQTVLGLQVYINKARLQTYMDELDFLFNKFLEEGHRARQKQQSSAATSSSVSPGNEAAGTNTTPPTQPPPIQGVTNEEAAQGLVDRSLTLLYYLCNARPLSNSNSLVGYSVTLGMIMALGYEIHGRIPPGKLLEVEPLLAGTPGAFVIVSKKWLRLNRVTKHVAQLSSVSQSFPSVRSVLEAILLGPNAKCNQ